MNRLAVIIIIAVAALTGSTAMRAQTPEDSYKFDFGVQLGMDGYLGDANESNLFAHPGIAGGVSFRYLSESRWTIRGIFNVLTLSGNTADMTNVIPGFESYKFNATAFDLGGRFEYNFFPYGIGETYKQYRRWTPYLALGVGVTFSMCDGHNAVAPNIPMAVGVKYKLSQRWNLGAEFCMTKVFGDRVDGELSDLYLIKSSFVKNTDWYSNISISITYEFGKRCATCHYVD